MQRLAEHGPCPVCGSHPGSMGVTFFQREDGAVVAEAIFQEAQQGPPGHAHGGMIAAVLDEAMGAAVWRAGYRAAALRVEVDYLRPVPLHRPVHVEARVGDVTGRAVRALARLTFPDGTLAAAGYGIFVEAPHLFDTIYYRLEGEPSEAPPDPTGSESRPR